MTTLRGWVMRLWGTLRRHARDREIEEELRTHLELAAEQMESRGAMPPDSRDAARRAARLRYGSMAQAAESMRDQRGFPWLTALASDLRYAFRMLRRSPGFASLAVVIMALGIGANTAVFSVVNAVLIKPLPYPDPDALVGVWHSAVRQGVKNNNVTMSGPMYFGYREQNRTFEKFGVWSGGASSVTGGGDPEQVRTLSVTDEILPALGVPPAVGRWFSRADDTTGTPETVILTYGYWQRRFGGDRAIVGRALTIDSRPREVIGIMPRSFRFLDRDPELILPQRLKGDEPPGNLNYTGMARLEPGITLAQADAEIARSLPGIMTALGMSKRTLETLQFAPALRPLKQDVVGDLGKVLWVLMGSIGIVLLIACANVTNLLLVRAHERQHEFAIRAALGASWGTIAREHVLESVLLSVLGGLLGLVLASGGLQLLASTGPANLPRLNDIAIDPLVLAFTAGASLLAGLLSGFLSVMKHTGTLIAHALRGSGRSASLSRDQHRLQNTLVAVQVALALVLLVSSGLMIHSFQALRIVQPGFTHPGQIQTVRISIPAAQVEEPQRVTRMQNEILNKMSAIPGVTSAAFMTSVPMETGEQVGNSGIAVEDKPSADGQLSPVRRAKSVSPGSFQTLGTAFIAGRDFTWTDIYDNREVAVISERMAKETWGSVQAALGKRIRENSPGDPWREVIGVVSDVYDNGVHLPAPAIVYWPARWQAVRVGIPNFVPRSVVFAVRTERAGTESFLKELQQAVWSVNSSLPLAQVQTLGAVYSRSMARTSFTLLMLGIAGAMALLMGVVGIYGVISYVVSQRRREIGIRVALGAQAGEVKRMFVRYGLAPAAIGIACGLGVSVALTRLMASLLFGISPLDPMTYASVPIILATAAVLASYLPARRAAAVDPAKTLRAE
ncbi:MAG TPA: ABC transporter permease [Bryobacteraceae bacterium]|nr:ABC transporter permease [Bryobacteraceae bacterium]